MNLKPNPSSTQGNVPALGETKQVDDMVLVSRAALEAIAADVGVQPEVDREWLCKVCGSWTPPNHPEAHDHEEGCTAVVDCQERRDSAKRIRALIANAVPVPTLDEDAEAWIVECKGSTLLYRTKGEASDMAEMLIGNARLRPLVYGDVPATATVSDTATEAVGTEAGWMLHFTDEIDFSKACAHLTGSIHGVVTARDLSLVPRS